MLKDTDFFGLIYVPDASVILFSAVRNFRPCDVKCGNKVSGYGSKVHYLNMKYLANICGNAIEISTKPATK